MGRDATHHGRSVARSRRDTGRRPRLSLQNDARVSLSLSIDRNRGGRATDPTTPTTRILHHLYNIYTESRGGGMYPTTSASVLRDDYLYARSRGGGGWKGGRRGGGELPNVPSGRQWYVYVARRAGGEGESIISQGLMKFSVNEQSTRSIFFTEASYVFGECGSLFLPASVIHCRLK